MLIRLVCQLGIGNNRMAGQQEAAGAGQGSRLCPPHQHSSIIITTNMAAPTTFIGSLPPSPQIDKKVFDLDK